MVDPRPLADISYASTLPGSLEFVLVYLTFIELNAETRSFGEVNSTIVERDGLGENRIPPGLVLLPDCIRACCCKVRAHLHEEVRCNQDLKGLTEMSGL